MIHTLGLRPTRRAGQLSAPVSAKRPVSDPELIDCWALRYALTIAATDEGYAAVEEVGQHRRQLVESFDARNYGYQAAIRSSLARRVDNFKRERREGADASLSGVR